MNSSSSGPARIVVVDDDPSVRHGLQLRLDTEPDLQVVGTAGTGAEAIGLARRLQPDLVLMDVRLSNMDGFDATRVLRQTCPDVAVVMLSLYDGGDTRRAARAAGATAFVSKHDSDGELLRVLRQLHDGTTPSTPASPQETQ